jgi:hypothetical protein
MVCCGASVQVRVVVLCRRIRHCHWRGDQFSGARDVGLADGAGEPSVVADVMEPLRQNVEQEACSAHPGALDSPPTPPSSAFGRIRGRHLPRPAVDARQRLAFAQRFGGVDLKRFFAAVPGYPVIAQVRTVPEQRRRPDLIEPQTRSA